MAAPSPRWPLAAVLIVASAPVGAVDWSVSGFFSQRIEATSNSGLDGEGGVVGAISDLGMAFRLATPTTQWTLAPGVRGALYTGPGDDGSLDDFGFRFNGSVAHQAPRSSTTASFSVIPDSTTFSDFDSGGNSRNRNTTQITYSANMGYTYNINEINSLSLSAFGRKRDFTEQSADLEPSLSFGGGATWRRELDPATAGSLGFTVTRFTADSLEDPESLSYEVRAGLDRQLSPRATLGGTLGVALVDSERNRVRPGGTVREDDLSPSFVGDLTLSYAAAPDTRYTFGLSQSIDQNTDGTVESRASVSAGVQHSINRRSRAGLTGRLGFNNPVFDDGGDTSDRITLSVQPAYFYALTPNWDASLGYALRVEDANGVETSHQVFFQISRGLSFLP